MGSSRKRETGTSFEGFSEGVTPYIDRDPDEEFTLEDEKAQLRSEIARIEARIIQSLAQNLEYTTFSDELLAEVVKAKIIHIYQEQPNLLLRVLLLLDPVTIKMQVRSARQIVQQRQSGENR